MRESFPKQVDKKSRGPQRERGLEFSRRKKGQPFFPSLHSLGLYNNNISCLRTVSGLNLLANPVILKCKLWEFSSVTQSCPTLCDPMNRSTLGLPVIHQLLEFTQIHVHRVSDVIQPSHPQLSPSPPALNPSQQQSLFQWVNSSHEVAKVLELSVTLKCKLWE